jgi:ABC-2 type transport system ATP-binding protein
MTAQENLELVCKIKGINYAKVNENWVVGLTDRQNSKIQYFFSRYETQQLSHSLCPIE